MEITEAVKALAEAWKYREFLHAINNIVTGIFVWGLFFGIGGTVIHIIKWCRRNTDH